MAYHIYPDDIRYTDGICILPWPEDNEQLTEHEHYSNVQNDILFDIVPN